MGNEASYQMGMATNFDAEEIKRLGKRFKKLDLVRFACILFLFHYHFSGTFCFALVELEEP